MKYTLALTAAILILIASMSRQTPRPTPHTVAHKVAAIDLAARSSLPSRSEKPAPSERLQPLASTAEPMLEPEWHMVLGSSFGGATEYQSVAYSNLTTRQLIGDEVVNGKRGFYQNGKFIETDFHFVAMRRPDLARRGVLLRYRGKISHAMILDYGPAEYTRRDIDLSENLAQELGYETDTNIEWRLVK